MKVLVYPHDLGIGGSQLNAIDLGHEISNRGHDVIFYGQPGALAARIAQLGLEFVESPDPGRRPTPEIASDLSRLIRQRGIDIAHGYEWPPGLECYLACRGNPAARAVTTVMSMAVAPFLPHGMPLAVGTEQIAVLERSRGRRLVSIIEPPVDTISNRPGAAAADRRNFRETWDLDDGIPTVLCVSRLARQLKLEGLLMAIDAVESLDPELPMRLLIVGDGEARREIDDRAARVNRALGRDAVVLTGEVNDPRAAYDLADVCLGMGGSALRSMAFAKPLIVQGEGGFFRLLTPETLDDFLWTGWYGHGSATADPVGDLRHLLLTLLRDPRLRQSLGAFGRSVIEDRFSLDAAADRQLEIYHSTLQLPPRPIRRLGTEVSAAASFARYQAAKRGNRVMGRKAADDFNARPVARTGPARVPDGTGLLVYFAGVSWDAVAGTDRHLATALARSRPVIWVDPPMSWTARRRRNVTVPRLSLVGPGITRVNTSCPPGVSRPVLRRVARWLTARQARKAIGPIGMVEVILVSSPEQLMPAWGKDAVKVYYETDDFVAGASLLGITPRYAEHCRAANVRRSHVVMGITDSLTHTLTHDGVTSATLANGTDIDHFRHTDHIRPAEDVHLQAPIAGVVGQLNDRLDLAMLEAVVTEGTSLLLLGPRHDVDADTRERLDQLIALPTVQWIDRQPFDRLPSYLATIDVGLTPYSTTAFNLASYPLKTLEYLAAGLPVVSTDLPSARGIDPDLATLASSPEDFAKAVRHVLERPPEPDARQRRRSFVESHSWQARALRFDAIIDDALAIRTGGTRS